MGRNIVICCDGTGNEVGRTISNVLKLYRIMERSDRQRVYYNPGVGTIGHQGAWRRLRQRIRGVFGLATGNGMDEHVLGAYRFLCETYQEGDRIWLFGFSRGAYTVRVLAALVHVIGLLPPDQLNLAGYALTVYKDTNRDTLPEEDAEQAPGPSGWLARLLGRSGNAAPQGVADRNPALRAAWDFSQVVEARHAVIEFMGVWDTVASVIVPGGLGRLPQLRMLRFTRTNPSVKRFRQAMAIDERRRMFRLNRWIDKQNYRPDRFRRETETPQDISEVWFAGVHADIGGGYPEAESGLSKFPLGWMIAEATAHGLLVENAMIERLVKGVQRPGNRNAHVAPDAGAIMHQSMTWGWRPLEWLPKRARWREWGKRGDGWYLPRSEPRVIPEGAQVHHSVRTRMATVPGYKPVNLAGMFRWVEEEADPAGT